MKELVIFDVDNTLICGQSQRLVLSYLRSMKIVGFFYYLTIMAWFLFYKMGLIRDPKRVMSFAYAFIKGKTPDEEWGLVDSFMKEIGAKHIFPEAMKCINDHRKNGRRVILLSNAPDIIVKKLADHLNIEEYLCTKMEVVGGVYTGKISGDIMYGSNKMSAIERYVKETGHQYDLADVWAYADHASDLPLLRAVGHPVARRYS